MDGKARCSRGLGDSDEFHGAEKDMREHRTIEAASVGVAEGGVVAAEQGEAVGEQVRIFCGVGLSPGGAQRTTEPIQSLRSLRPSSRLMATGLEASPSSWRTGYMKSPEPSPVKGRPVRLAPWAPGARPRTRMRALRSPNPGTGLAQYSWSR